MKQGNCLLYAVWKWVTQGGYLVIRKSKHFGHIPHFLHLDPDKCEHKWCLSHFAPDTPKSNWRKFAHKLWFKGRVRRGDD